MRRREIPEEPETLQAGDLRWCARCRECHVMEGNTRLDAMPYDSDMLFVTCQNGKRYYVGNVGYPANWRSPLKPEE